MNTRKTSPRQERIEEPGPLQTVERERNHWGEWTASPPGRLGRRLLVDVDRYLEFFAVARS